MELAGIPLLSLLDVEHERWEDGHGNFKFGESFKFIDPHPPRHCSVHRIAPMGSGEPYQVTRLKKSTSMHRPRVHEDIPESFVSWSDWFGLQPNWEAIAQPKQYYIIAQGQ